MVPLPGERGSSKGPKIGILSPNDRFLRERQVMSHALAAHPHSVDRLGRKLRDLRISVIDKCNLRCTYCMPKEHYGERYEFLPRKELLTFEEIARVSSVFQRLGVVKIRLTGGEPLLRNSIQTLVGLIRQVEGIEDIALTTNGLLLPQFAGPLKDAGLNRITVSLDALDPDTNGEINGMGIAPERVLQGIAAAREAGFSRIKVNTVIQRGINESAALELAEHFRNTGCIVRFIEFMDVGNINGWSESAVVSSREIHGAIHAKYPLRSLEENYTGEVARRYAYEDGAGEIGFISSVTKPFCGGCTRARLSADGKLYTCLFGHDGYDLRKPMRDGATDRELESLLDAVWSNREDRYSEIRFARRASTDRREKVEMYQIGG